MKKTTLRQAALKLAVVAIALFAPTGLWAQEILTVNDGTATNEYVPFYGWYGDAVQTNQLIYPASDLAAMTGGEITQMVFYVASQSGSNTLCDWVVSIGETSATTLSGIDNTTTLTQVYSGAMTFGALSGATTMTIVFDQPYTYNGGNLLIQFNNPVTNSSAYHRYYFTGIGATGASYCYGQQRNFLPKVTFTYEPVQQGGCAKPGQITLGTAGATQYPISWTAGGEETSWNVYLTQEGSPVAGYNPLVVNTTPSCTFSGLTAGTTYDVAIEAICGSEVSAQRTKSFTTALCEASDRCEISIYRTDQYDDSWNGGSIAIMQNGNLVATVDCPSNLSGTTVNYAVCKGVPVSFVFTRGNYPGEIGVTITDGGGEVVYEATSMSSVSAGTFLTIDNACPSCYKVLNLTHSDETTDGVTLTWEADTRNDAGVVTYTIFNVTDNVVYASGVTATSQIVSGLNENTPYEFTVTTDCGSGDLAEAATVSFTTLASCPAPTATLTDNSVTAHGATIQWNDMGSTGYNVRWQVSNTISEGFENGSLNDWNLVNSNTSNTRVATNAAHNSNYGFKFNYDETNDASLISPVLSGTEDGVTISFYYKEESNSYGDEQFYVGYSTNETAEAPADFTYGNIVTASLNWQLYENSFPAGTKRIAIKYVYNDALALFIDDIEIVIPNDNWITDNTANTNYTITGLTAETRYLAQVQSVCGEDVSSWSEGVSFTTTIACPAPTALTAGAATTNSVDLSWTAGGEETAWTIYYKKTTDENYTEVSNVTTNPYTLSGLTPASNYQFYVVANCSANEASHPSETANFTTECEAKTIDANNIYTDNFDSYTGSSDVSTGTVGPSNYPGHKMPLCWSFLNMSENTSNIPQAFLSSISGYNVTGNSLFFRSSSNTPIYAILPEFTNDISDLMLTFTYRNEGVSASNGTLIVGYMTDPADASTFTTVLTCDRTTTLTEKEVFFADAPAGSYMAFKYQGGSSNNFYLSIDNVSVTLVPTCRKPKTPVCDSKTAHTATLSWTNGEEGQTAWQIAYSTDANFTPDNDFTPDETTTWLVEANTNPFTINGLNANTTYRAYVRANCGTDDGVSNWSVLYANFTTLAGNLAPTAFHTTDLQAEQVGMDWTPAGNDNETSWTILLNDENIENINDVEDVDLLGTASMRNAGSHPTVITGLTPEHTYYAWIRSNNQADGVSSWVAITGNTFTTTALCPQPTDVVANDVTNNSATISWDGHGETEFTVSYRTAEGIDGMIEEFSTTQTPTGWERKSGLLSDALNGTAPTSNSSGWNFNSTNVFGAYHARLNIYGTSCKYWLITPEVILNDGANALAFDLALTDYNYADAIENPEGQADDKFAVLISTDDGTTWEILREWNNSGSEYIYNNIATAGEHVSLDLSSYSGAIKIAFYGESTESNNGDNDLHIDNVAIGATIPAGEWFSVNATDATEASISPLDENTKYEVVVSPGCDLAVESTPVFFTTASLFPKEIEANKWYAIASPVHNEGNNETLAGVVNLTTTGTDFAYDLYGYNEGDGSWEKPTTILNRGKGYIYRRSNDATLQFVGYANTGSVSVNVSSSCPDIDLKGFNLIGNPYPHAVAINHDHYTLNANGSWTAKIEGSTIGEAEACLVYYSYASYYTTYSFSDVTPDVTLTSSKGNSANSALAFTVSNDEFEDVAYARFDNGEGLPKIGHLAANAPMLSIPVEGRRYAIANLGSDCQSFNLVFRGVNGTYTIKQSSNQAIAYCHLIDRVAGKDIDMLRQPSYTFSSNGFDPDRFMVKLSPDAQENANGNFAYWNGNSWMVEGNGTLQVFDALGRQLFSQEISNSNFEIQNSLFPAAGVYVLRMGEKTQKIVVR